MRNRVAEHVAALPKSGIRKFFDIVAQSKDIVSLGVGEPDFDTPWHISRAAVTCLENGGTHYTSNLGTPELRQAICRYLERRFCAKFDWKCEVLATVGVFGEAYVNTLKDGLLSRGWVDVYPSRSKRGGAFSASSALYGDVPKPISAPSMELAET